MGWEMPALGIAAECVQGRGYVFVVVALRGGPCLVRIGSGKPDPRRPIGRRGERPNNFSVCGGYTGQALKHFVGPGGAEEAFFSHDPGAAIAEQGLCRACDFVHSVNASVDAAVDFDGGAYG